MFVKTFFVLLSVAAAQDTGTNCVDCGDCDCCVDLDPKCPTWAEQGECDTNAHWMWPNCPKSCNKCPHCPNCPCQDLHPDCAKWADKGECDTNAHWMWPNCPKSCDKCPHGGDCEKCQDLNPSCYDWAEQGECDLNPDWMWGNCPKSCGKCPHCPHCSKTVNIKSCTGGVDWPDGTGLILYFEPAEGKAGKHMGGGANNVLARKCTGPNCGGIEQQWKVDCCCCGDNCGDCGNGNCDCDCGKCKCPTQIRWNQDPSKCIESNCDENGCNAEVMDCKQCDCASGDCKCSKWILEGEEGKDWHTRIKLADHPEKCLFSHSSIQSDGTANIYMDDCGEVYTGYGTKNGEMFHPSETFFAVEDAGPQ